jgi:hypothetical protein
VLAAAVLKLCVDPAKMAGCTERDAFLRCFFTHYLDWLVLPLSSTGAGGAGPAEQSAVPAEQASCKVLVCELLSYLAFRTYGTTVRAFLQHNAHVSAGVVRLLQDSDLEVKVRAVCRPRRLY